MKKILVTMISTYLVLTFSFGSFAVDPFASGTGSVTANNGTQDVSTS